MDVIIKIPTTLCDKGKPTNSHDYWKPAIIDIAKKLKSKIKTNDKAEIIEGILGEVNTIPTDEGVLTFRTPGDYFEIDAEMLSLVPDVVFIVGEASPGTSKISGDIL